MFNMNPQNNTKLDIFNGLDNYLHHFELDVQLFNMLIVFSCLNDHSTLKMRKLLSFRRLSMHSPWEGNSTMLKLFTNLSWFLSYYLCNCNKNVSSSNIWNFIWFKWLEKSHRVIQVNLFFITIKIIIITWYM